MRSVVAVPLITTIAVALSACRSASPSDTTATADTVPAAAPCSAMVTDADVSGWHTVEGQGFTMCLPPHWKGDRGHWRRGAASVSWGVGTPPMITEMRVVKLGGGEGESHGPVAQGSTSEARTYNESIGGHNATLYWLSSGTAFGTLAIWTDPEMYLSGDAPDDATARLELDIYRTVRFTRR